VPIVPTGPGAYDCFMVSRRSRHAARLFGLLAMVAGSVALGFVLGMARPRPGITSTGSPAQQRPEQSDRTASSGTGTGRGT